MVPEASGRSVQGFKTSELRCHGLDGRGGWVMLHGEVHSQWWLIVTKATNAQELVMFYDDYMMIV